MCYVVADNPTIVLHKSNLTSSSKGLCTTCNFIQQDIKLTKYSTEEIIKIMLDVFGYYTSHHLHTGVLRKWVFTAVSNHCIFLFILSLLHSCRQPCVTIATLFYEPQLRSMCGWLPWEFGWQEAHVQTAKLCLHKENKQKVKSVRWVGDRNSRCQHNTHHFVRLHARPTMFSSRSIRPDTSASEASQGNKSD